MGAYIEFGGKRLRLRNLFIPSKGWVLFIPCLLFLMGASLAPAAAQSADDDPIVVARKLDQLIAKHWSKNGLRPAPPTTDAEFLRRVCLDLVGVIPTADMAIDFLKSKDPNKRIQLVEQLIDSELYVERWVEYWMETLVGRGGQINRGSLRMWLRQAIENNMPYDEFVRQLITATGNSEENGAVNYILRWRSLPEITANSSRLFLGVRIMCCQCHDHKEQKNLKQEYFWQFAAFFSQMGVQENRVRGMMMRQWVIHEGNGPTKVKYEVRTGPKKDIVEHRETEARLFIPVKLPAGAEKMTPRQRLAALITSPENPYFARAIVNRMWFVFFGRGLVDPMDDLRETNPPSMPDVLDFLAEDFVAHGYDLQRLHRIIVNSQVYQISSRGPKVKDEDNVYFIKARLRFLSPEQMFYSVLQATGLGDASQLRRRQDIENMKANYLSRFVRMFDTDEVQEETNFEGTITQALMLLNGDLINSCCTTEGESLLAQLLTSNLTESQKVDYIFLMTVSRYPTKEEKSSFLRELQQSMPSMAMLRAYAQRRNRTLAAAAARSQAQAPPGDDEEEEDPRITAYRHIYEDLMWSLLNSSEFMFNH